jgi:SAM-dependent methyltransferase
MVSAELLARVRCPSCRGGLVAAETALRCVSCGIDYARAGAFVDLRPREAFTEQTKYLDETLHADARHETVSPPLLSAAVRLRMLQRFLAPGPGDRVLDLGCGSGRVLVWNHGLGAYLAGVDVSPFFAREACAAADLALGDLRRLPLADGAFNKAYALDVFEHLSRDALRQVLDEASRVLEPGGHLFVYSHVRKNAPIAAGLRAINRLARGLERLGLMDLTQERLRKSDHVNPLADIPDLERMVAASGFRIARIRYYTPLLAGFVENIVVRVAEHSMSSRASREAAREPLATPPGAPGAERAPTSRAAAKEQLARGGAAYQVLRAVTWLLNLDVLLWGRIRSGPFFALLEKERGR